ncbi:MAG: hypothetical protein A3D96_01935 [Chlamydiae bacterium RIFCSPHIGHO2_12_FULL_44_59]|nr:MAG: hypothetical protein A2796_04625 [Chlamydiae bacterium RIFCSPHIGHO2_01_FULL_44_39]OGN59303.1 MAG: hypothetical protein A3C42_04905 [Chlamydiae bacterium RIFCSPHIGHO2_02_FULL_45_9]OGN60670.1 MAG: hypothetical protein A3D96_01935 [Chlamydiae bacterium RIFCSPHIGHO2_12_FULL_44_59]OGN66930.1 MAG: hypothetical protein A2978_02165 [Chlamydiae bacterium RIFCSPLOWO2_01_FULL_44_52]OGN67482.1 MAG: hypothetical protein A3I67_03380 [Chlamydiae bacterium RIFCSPLOWO2_02_FULL_45_22]OGN71183.1 MAG: hyp
MKYQNFLSFQKHLKEAAPDRLCPIYLVAVVDDFERAQAMDEILQYFSSPPDRYGAGHCTLPNLMQAIETKSLFGETVIVLDEVEALSKKEQEQLMGPLRHPAGYVVLGARSKVPELASFVESQGVIFDQLSEKPWDKEKRLVLALVEKARRVGKVLAPEVAHFLLERLGPEPALLMSEIEKLLCFVGENTAIRREDILELSPVSRTSTFWQVAEKVIWERGDFAFFDSLSFHALLPILRNQLQLGLTLSSLIEDNTPADQWGAYLPHLFPKILEKRSSQAARLGSGYFQKGLHSLFEMELSSRTNSTQYQALLDQFTAKLYGW